MLFAIPWTGSALGPDNEVFMRNVHRATLKKVPGFDEDDWAQTWNRECIIEIRQ